MKFLASLTTKEELQMNWRIKEEKNFNKTSRLYDSNRSFHDSLKTQNKPENPYSRRHSEKAQKTARETRAQT
jgi:hypothetical protein